MSFLKASIGAAVFAAIFGATLMTLINHQAGAIYQGGLMYLAGYTVCHIQQFLQRYWRADWDKAYEALITVREYVAKKEQEQGEAK